jgi:hypothetical protein
MHLYVWGRRVKACRPLGVCVCLCVQINSVVPVFCVIGVSREQGLRLRKNPKYVCVHANKCVCACKPIPVCLCVLCYRSVSC